MSQARSQMPQGTGTTTAGLGFGGQTPASPGFLTLTEEWSSSSNVVKTLTD